MCIVVVAEEEESKARRSRHLLTQNEGRWIQYSTVQYYCTGERARFWTCSITSYISVEMLQRGKLFDPFCMVSHH
jgi:hypothetical protein